MNHPGIAPLAKALRLRLGSENVLSAKSDLAVYDCDAFTIEKCRPDVVVFPRSTRHVAEVVKLCNEYDVPVVPRGAGTSLAGGCLPVGGGVVVMLTRMRKIVQVNLRDRFAVLEPGLPNLQLTRALSGTGYHYSPDPSSQTACTIGGNVGTNAGGPHTLKYGVTINHVLGLEAVLGDGSSVTLGPVHDPAKLDLVGLLVGSEGTLGIVTKLWVRLTPDPQDYRTMRAIFDTVDDATNAISDIIGAGVIPAAMELMDQGIVGAVEEAFHFGFPLDAEAIVVIELDGPAAGLDRQQQQVVDLCRKWQARQVVPAATAEEREALWKCRKMAIGALGRLSPSYCIQDGVVPRTRLPHIIRRVSEIGRKYDLRIVNVAHAGDGNVHPIILFDERDKDQVARVLAAGEELLEECIRCGGSVTAEHGIGVEKLTLMSRLFTDGDLEGMARVRDAFNPNGRLSPGKLLPAFDRKSEVGSRKAEVGSRRSEVGCGAVDLPSPASDLRSPTSPQILPLSETVTPPDQAAVAEVVRRAWESGTPIYPIGGGTGLHYGVRPKRPGLGLSLAGLDRVIDYPARDLTITVEAGVTVAELAGRLASERQRLPVDIPRAERATVGGVVATNFSGPRRYLWGSLRDYVIGIHAVDGRGMAFSGGGRVVKNAAGYNICRLLTGSLGTLGVITQVTLMVKPMPETSALVACDVADFDVAERLLAELVHSRTLPAAIELLVGPAWPLDHGLAAESRSAAGRLVVGFEGTSAEVDWMIDELGGQWRRSSGVSPGEIRGDSCAGAWQSLTEFPTNGSASDEARLCAEINVLPSAVVDLVRLLLEVDQKCSIQAHAGDGVIRVQFSREPKQVVAELADRVRPAAAEAAGSTIVSSYPGSVELSRGDVWGPAASGAEVMQSLKSRFDPKGILNPDRFAYPSR